MFLLPSLVIGPRFMLTSLLILESCQFLLTEDRLEIWKLEITPYECRLKPVEWGKSGIPNLAGMSLIESY